MTQYDDRVARQKEKNDAEEWGKRVKYIHANDGVIETAFNNGDVKFETRLPLGGGKLKYKTHWHRENWKGDTLLHKFGAFMSDVRSGVDPLK